MLTATQVETPLAFTSHGVHILRNALPLIDELPSRTWGVVLSLGRILFLSIFDVILCYGAIYEVIRGARPDML